jgi:hypothetical protein
MITDDRYPDYLSFCFAVATTIFASGISIITLSIALIAGKRDELQRLITDCKHGGISLTLAKHISTAQRYIKTMKEVTRFALYAIIASIIAVVLYVLFKLLPSTICIHFLGLSIVVSIILLSICLYTLIKWLLKAS